MTTNGNKNIYLDTNYLLRFILGDVDRQEEKVKSLFLAANQKKVSLYCSALSLFEINWVLSSVYAFDSGKVIQVLQNILKLNFIEFEHEKVFSLALDVYQNSRVSLEDCFHLAYTKAYNMKIATFDKKLKKLATDNEVSIV